MHTQWLTVAWIKAKESADYRGPGVYNEGSPGNFSLIYNYKLILLFLCAILTEVQKWACTGYKYEPVTRDSISYRHKYYANY